MRWWFGREKPREKNRNRKAYSLFNMQSMTVRTELDREQALSA